MCVFFFFVHLTHKPFRNNSSRWNCGKTSACGTLSLLVCAVLTLPFFHRVVLTKKHPTARLHQSLRKLYTPDIAENWGSQTPQRLNDLEAAEWGYMKTQALTIGTRMVRLSLSADFVCSFIKKVCFASRVSQEKEEQLLAMIETLPQHDGALNQSCTPPAELMAAARVVLWLDSKRVPLGGKHVLAKTEQRLRAAVPDARVVVLGSLSELDDWLTQYSDFLVPKLRVVVNHTHDIDARSIAVAAVLNLLRGKHGLTAVPLLELLSRKTRRDAQAAALAPGTPHVATALDADAAAAFCASVC